MGRNGAGRLMLNSSHPIGYKITIEGKIERGRMKPGTLIIPRLHTYSRFLHNPKYGTAYSRQHTLRILTEAC
jgi:hypothetical protein